MAIKKTWIVCDMDGFVICRPENSAPYEFGSEKAAVTRAKIHVKTSDDSEAWVFELSHVVSRPDVEPVVERVK